MIIQQDPEPPLKRLGQKNKTAKRTLEILNKNYRNTISYTSGFFSKAIFLLASELKNFPLWNSELMGKLFVRQNLSHFVMVFLALLVVSSNFVVKSAKAKLHVLVASEPEKEISISNQFDYFTPLIEQDGIKVEKAYTATTEGFFDVSASPATNITEREEPLPDNSGTTVDYVVRPGDNLTTLGWKFDLKLSTLKYYNSLTDADLIKPGQNLKVPPKGTSVSASMIAKKEAELENKRVAASSRSSGSSNSLVEITHAAGARNNGYPYGYCTYYVATRRYVPTSWGNAKSWLYSASRAGYSTGSSPAVGAIVVTSESWWGHVAYVERVSGNTITIAEMNYRGWGVINRRTLPAYGGVVRGYVY